MRNHFPDWLFAVLVLSVGGVIVFYTLMYGNPNTLSTNQKNTENYKALIAKQVTLHAIQNRGNHNDIRLSTVYITYLDSSLSLKTQTISFKKSDGEFRNNSTISFDEKHNEAWKGQCIYVMAEYWRKEDLCINKDFIFKAGDDIPKNGVLIIY